jgi:hypothetical protein
MKHQVIKQMGWRNGIRYFGDDLFSYISFCYDTFDEFLHNEDYDITDESMDKEERYEIDGRYVILNRDLFEYVRDIALGNYIKLVRFPDVDYNSPIVNRDDGISYATFNTIDTVMFRSDRIDDVIKHLSYQMKKKRETFLHNKTNVL